MCATAEPWLTGPFMRDRRYAGKLFAGAAALNTGQYRPALKSLLELREMMDQHSTVLSWYWRMALQIHLTESLLAIGDFVRARFEADLALDLTQRTEEHTWQARAWEVSARVALAEADKDRARRDVQRAMYAMQGYDTPLAAWRVHAVAATICTEDTQREEHMEALPKIIAALAVSLDSRPDLQQIFFPRRT